MFPALGFGARLPPNGQVSHEFALVSKESIKYLYYIYHVNCVYIGLFALVSRACIKYFGLIPLLVSPLVFIFALLS